MEVKIFRTQMGEVIGKIQSVDDTAYQLTDAAAFSARPVPNTQEYDAVFSDIAIFAEKSYGRDGKPLIDLELPFSAVLMAYVPTKEIVENYLESIEAEIEAVSAPVTPNKKTIIT